MSPLPKGARKVRRGVFVARDGRLFIRAEVKGPDGRTHRIGPRLSETQPSGRRMDERMAAEVAAEAELLQRMESVRRGDYQAASAPSWTVRTWAEYVWAHSPASDKTAAERVQRAAAWLAVIGDCPLESLSPVDVERAWDAVLAVPGRSGEAPRAHSTLRLVRSGIAQVINAGASRGLTDGNPYKAALLGMPRDTSTPRDAYEAAEIVAVLRELPEGRRPMHVFQWALGLRVGEARSARWEHIDQVAEGVRFTIAGDREKTGTTRRLILPRGVLALLEEHRHRFGNAHARTGPLFPSVRRPDLPFSTDGTVAAFGTAAKRIGSALRSHDLRAHFEQQLDRLGVRPFVRDVIVGHRPQTMGDRYNAAAQREVVEALELMWATVEAAMTSSTKSVPRSVPSPFQNPENAN